MSKKKKKFNLSEFDWDAYKVDTDWEDTLPNPEFEDSEEDLDYDSWTLEEDSTNEAEDDDPYDDDPIELAGALTMKDIFGDSLDEADDESNSCDDAIDDDEDGDDDDDFVLQCQRPLSMKDLGLEGEDAEETDTVNFATLMAGNIPKVEETLSDATQQPSGGQISSTLIPMVAEQAETVQPPLATQVKKENGRRQTLQDMQNAIVAQVPLITHNGGLYYYNGRTYKALGSSYELLGLVRSKVSTTAFASTTTKQFFDLLVYLKADDRLTPVHYGSRLKNSKYKVVLNNGVLDLESMELHPHSSRYLTFHELEADYVQKKPKVFLRFLEQVSGWDSEISRRIAEVVGYLLSGLNHRYFFVAGTAPGSGKSTLGLLLQALVGADQVSSISTHQLDRRFALGSTRNKILNLAMDVPKGHLSSVAVSLIKSITGGDPIEIEEKYQPTERIISNLRFLFGTNYPITVSESDDEAAFWQRMVVLPFTKSVPPHLADLTLLDKLIEEKDEITSYCLRALSRVIANNMQFSPCAVADQMKAEWRNTAIDPRSWEEFFYSHVTITGQDEDSIFAMELYDRYKTFCWEHQYDPIPYLNMRNWIAANISTDNCSPKRIHRTNENPRAGYVGLCFITSNERKDNL